MENGVSARVAITNSVSLEAGLAWKTPVLIWASGGHGPADRSGHLGRLVHREGATAMPRFQAVRQGAHGEFVNHAAMGVWYNPRQ